jgi:uncharacterized metal-binding protein
MASGKTHDWMTLALLPSVWLICRWKFNLALPESILIVAGTFIGGFFLSPDLDIRSRPFYRWGLLRFIWWPYQWAIRHRSSLSHGIFLASWLRLLYLTGILTILYAIFSIGLQQLGWWPVTHPLREARQFIQGHLHHLLWLGVGLWIGALIHILLDWFSSAFYPKKRRR